MKPTTAHRLYRALATALICLVSALPAHADRIDGEWCHAGQSMKIDGPTIITPAGNKLQGTYSRHDFHYTVPPGEPGAGTDVNAELLNEDEMQVTTKLTPKPIVWRRCQAIS